MKRSWNPATWIGVLPALVSILSYPFYFIRIPASRDFPWANLPLLALGLVLIARRPREALAAFDAVNSSSRPGQ